MYLIFQRSITCLTRITFKETFIILLMQLRFMYHHQWIINHLTKIPTLLHAHLALCVPIVVTQVILQTSVTRYTAILLVLNTRSNQLRKSSANNTSVKPVVAQLTIDEPLIDKGSNIEMYNTLSKDQIHGIINYFNAQLLNDQMVVASSLVELLPHFLVWFSRILHYILLAY